MMKIGINELLGVWDARRLRIREFYFTGRLLEEIPLNSVDLDADICAVEWMLLESRNIDSFFVEIVIIA